jgi:PAS domain S-box-containing protein
MKDVFAYSNSPFNPLETIHHLIRAIGRAERIEEIYEEAINGLQNTVAADRASILLFDADGVMRFKAWRGLSEPYRRAVEGHTPWTINDTNPQPVLVADVTQEPMADALRATLRAEGIGSMAFIPLVSRGRLLGKFMVYYNAPHKHGAKEVQLAQIIAGHVAFAIEQKRAEQVLKASEERFSTAFKANPDPMAIHSIGDGRFVEVNDSFLSISGYTRDEVIGHTITELSFLDEPSPLNAAARLLREQGRVKDFEFQFRTKTGDRRWGLISAEVIEIGGEAYILSTTSDITARRQMEEVLQRQAQRAALRADISMALALKCTLPGVLQKCAEAITDHLRVAFTRIWLLQEDDLLQLAASAGPYTDPDGAHSRVRVGALKIGQIAEQRQPHLSNDVQNDAGLGDPDWARRESLVAFAGYPLLVEDRLIGVLALFSKTPLTSDTHRALASVADVIAQGIERKKIEQEREQLLEREQAARMQAEATARLHRNVEEHLSLLVDASGVLLSSLDPQAVLTAILDLSRRLIPADAYAVWRYRETTRRWEIGNAAGLSPSYCQVTIDALSVIAPTHVPTVVSEDVTCDPLLANRLDLYSAEGIKSLLAVPLHLYGENAGTIAFYFKKPHQFSQAEVRIGTALANLASAAVTTAELFQEQTRLRLHAEESNRLKDEFLATVSHELRTPLTPLLGWTHLLQTHNVDAALLANGLEVIERNVRVQAQIVNDILDVSRIMTGKLRLEMQAVALAPIIEAAIETVSPAAIAKEIRVTTSLDQQLNDVRCDPDRLQQIVWNLLSNAIKFTPEGGAVNVLLARRDGKAQITVSDSGQGINADFLPHVFDRFRQADSSYTRKHGGLGLGLAIVRHLVELHGGTVKAHSDGADRGATFTVSLPLANQATSVAPPPVAQTTEPERGLLLAGVRLLLVDDDVDTLDVLGLTLRHYGAEVRSATSAAVAFEEMRQSSPDVLICDIGMPDEDGFAFIEKVRRLAPDQGGVVKAIALTAYARMEDRQRALASGFHLHLPKPVDPDELAARLVEMMAE